MHGDVVSPYYKGAEPLALRREVSLKQPCSVSWLLKRSLGAKTVGGEAAILVCVRIRLYGLGGFEEELADWTRHAFASLHYRISWSRARHLRRCFTPLLDTKIQDLLPTKMTWLFIKNPGKSLAIANLQQIPHSTGIYGSRMYLVTY